MRVLIDRHAMQAIVHLRDGVRLRDVIAAWSELPEAEVGFTDARELDGPDLAGADVLVVPTRSVSLAGSADRDLAFTDNELVAIADFVRRGGGLLLLTNHGDVGRAPDHTEQDARVAALFGVEIERSVFADPAGALTTIGEDEINLDADALRATRAVRQVVTNNCASVRCGRGEALVRLPASMSDVRDGRVSEGRLFAHALAEGPEVGDGRLITVADSGFMGSPGTMHPGPGLLDQGDNRAFLVHAVEWLSR